MSARYIFHCTHVSTDLFILYTQYHLPLYWKLHICDCLLLNVFSLCTYVPSITITNISLQIVLSIIVHVTSSADWVIDWCIVRVIDILTAGILGWTHLAGRKRFAPETYYLNIQFIPIQHAELTTVMLTWKRTSSATKPGYWRWNTDPSIFVTKEVGVKFCSAPAVCSQFRFIIKKIKS